MAKNEGGGPEGQIVPTENRMTIDKYLSQAHPTMSAMRRSIFLSKFGKSIKTDSAWATVVKAELTRKIQ